ncbi:MAG: hypothetical protein GC129_07230 [Proteobacteria bacterium]|nr:hypothetical protein [Pseudomonadota bacterium]
MLSVLFLSFALGLVMAAPVGPVGFTSMVQTLGGQRKQAFATMAGCLLAETVFAAILAGSTLLAEAFLPTFSSFFKHPPGWVYVLLGVTLMGAGAFMLRATKPPKISPLLSFTASFKITLLSVHQLANLTLLATIFGLVEHLHSPLHVAVFLPTYLLGLTCCWGGILQLCWSFRHRLTVRKLVPLASRAVGLLTALLGAVVLLQHFIFA